MVFFLKIYGTVEMRSSQGTNLIRNVFTGSPSPLSSHRLSPEGLESLEMECTFVKLLIGRSYDLLLFLQGRTLGI